MLRKIVAILCLVAALFYLRPQGAYAENCVQVYGGGVVCGASTEHEPIETDINIDPSLLGASFLALSAGFYFISEKVKKGLTE